MQSILYVWGRDSSQHKLLQNYTGFIPFVPFFYTFPLIFFVLFISSALSMVLHLFKLPSFGFSFLSFV